MPKKTVNKDFPKKYFYECLMCPNRWFGKRDPATVLHGAQCPRCFSYSIICHELIDQQIKEIKAKLPTKEQIDTFIELIEYLYEKGYIVNNESPEIVFQYLIKKLQESC